MKLTKGEILTKYKDRPNAKRIQEIADECECTANEIRKILHDAGEDVAVFGPGRPKKPTPETAADATLKEADKTLADTERKVSVKVEPVLCNSSVPQCVLDMCHERVLYINRQIQVYVEQVDALNEERNAIIDFVEGVKDESNGVHGEV